MAGLPKSEAIQKFTSLVKSTPSAILFEVAHNILKISHGDDHSNHQFILKPVSGEGRVSPNDPVVMAFQLFISADHCQS
jgi:hypothetical protein